MAFSKGSLPIRKKEVKELGNLRFCVGVYLLYGGAGSGKSLLGLALLELLGTSGLWLYVNEPHGTPMELDELKKRITEAKETFILVDSLSLLLARAAAERSGPAMKGGLTFGYMNLILSLEALAAESKKVVVAVVNTAVAPINTADALVTGLMEPHLPDLSLICRDRLDRAFRRISLGADHVSVAAAHLGYEPKVEKQASVTEAWSDNPGIEPFFQDSITPLPSLEI